MTYKAAAQQRVKNARKKGILKGFDFIEWHPSTSGIINKVLCRLCGDVIKELIKDEQPLNIIRKGDHTVKEYGMVLAATSNYTEILITFSDGTNHVAHCCASCSKNLTTELLEDMYAADLEDWISQGVSEGFLEINGARSPLSYTIVEN